jgi:hypothetical protein
MTGFMRTVERMAEQVREIRECENCHAEMRSLGKLPAIGAKPLIKVFHCHRCNRIGVDKETLSPMTVSSSLVLSSRIVSP